MNATVRYRSELDGLRAIAVGSVILNHFRNSIIPSGYLGVDIFFVISGYVITLSLCAREHRCLKDVLLGFYARRFKRLMPALIVCVVVTSVLLSFVNKEPGQSLKTGTIALFGFSNLYLFKISNDYFGELSQQNAFTHTWSLGVEEQFYIAFPVIIWIFLLRTRHVRYRAFYVGIFAMAALSLAVFAYVDGNRPMVSFYLMPLRFWELAAGCLVAIFHYERSRREANNPGSVIPSPCAPPRRAWSQHRLQWAQNALVGLMLVTLFLPPALALFANVALVALTAASLAMLSPGSLAYRLLTSRPATYLGIMSYSLYLWHWPVLVLSRYTVGVYWWSIPTVAGLMLLVAQLSYRLIEQPLRTRSWADTSGGTVLWGVTAASVAAGFVVILARPLNGYLYTGKPAQLVARNVESLSDAYRIPRTDFAWAGAKCILSADPEVGKVIPLDACTLGEPRQAAHRIMVFGNSFSAAFVQGFDDLVKHDHYAVTITSAWGASPIGEVPNASPQSQINAYYWDIVVPHMVSRLQPGDWVVLISDIAGLAPQHRTAQDSQDLKLYKAGLHRFSAELARHGGRLAVLDVNSFIRDSYCRPETALPQWFAPTGGPCKYYSRADTLARRRPIDTMLRQLERDRKLVVIDLIDLFCPGRTCTFVGNRNEVLYRDEYSHPSVEAVREAAPLLRQLLTGAGPAPPIEPPGLQRRPQLELMASRRVTRTHSSSTNTTATSPAAAVQRNTGA